MSLFQAPLLKSEVVEFAGEELQVFELSAFDRCEYLEKATENVPAPQGDKEVPMAEFKTVGQVWSYRREDVNSKLLLVAYALKPGREESLEDLHLELRQKVVPDAIDKLYIPAARLSGLYVEQRSEDGDSEEDAEKKG